MSKTQKPAARRAAVSSDAMFSTLRSLWPYL